MHFNYDKPNLSLRPQAESSGEETHTLTVSEMPSHSHLVNSSSNEANTIFPTNNIWAATNQTAYDQSMDTTMAPGH
jgi:microcystin-dependent protein